MRTFLFALSAGALIAAETPLSFLPAVQVIVDRNPEVRIQQETLEGLRAGNVPSRLRLLPTLSLSASHQSGKSEDAAGTRAGVEATSGINLFRFGSDLAGIRAGNAEVRAQELHVQDSILDAELTAVEAMVAFARGSGEVALLRRLVQNREGSAEIASKRFRKGLLAAQEVDKVVIDKENTVAELRDTETALAAYQAQLKNLLGNGEIETGLPWKQFLEGWATPLLLVGREDLEQRPDVAAVQEAKISAQAREGENFGKIFPSLDLFAGYGFFNTGAEWKGGLTLTIPLFDRLENYSAYRNAVHSKNAAAWELEKIRRKALSEWESAREALQLNLETAKRREQTLLSSRKLFAINERRFETGLANANELSLDFQRLLESEKLALHGWSQAHLSFARLCRALGRNLARCAGGHASG